VHFATRLEISSDSFGIIIAETRVACVIAIIWLGQKVGREQDGLKG
jgi:threonine/homoserine efflux transporter RhtA